MNESFPRLNLPQANLKLRTNDAGTEVFDVWRRKYLVLTPEEWVRQQFLHYLVEHLDYPLGLIGVEKSLVLGNKRFRTDALVHDRMGNALVLCEFKSVKVEIDQETLFQAAAYNRKLNLPYLILSNGLDHYCLKLSEKGGEFNYMERIPRYGEIA